MTPSVQIIYALLGLALLGFFSSLREDLADVAFDSDLLEQEKNALESQKNCMTQIEFAHLSSPDPAAE